MKAKPLAQRRLPLRAAFVMTASLGLACGRSQAEERNPRDYYNPPPPPQETPEVDPEPDAATDAQTGAAAPATASAAAADEPITRVNHPRLLNQKNGQGRSIKFAWRGDGCFVDGDLKGPVPPGSEPPAIPIECPPAMRDPAFAKCRGGELRASNSAGPSQPARCACFVPGNPPPPPERAECPTSP
jgi:hypothetical protein